MPSFSKSPPELVARFAELAELVPEATRRPMFGYPSLVIGGHMFAGLYQDSLVLRLGAGDRAELTSRHGAAQFEPMPGRPMTGFVIVPPALVADPAVERWLGRAFEHAKSLPPKKPKPS